MELSKVITYYREKMGMSQTDLALRLGVGRSTVGMWELGERVPGNKMQKKIASLLLIPPAVMLDMEEPDQAEAKPGYEDFPEIAMIGRASRRMTPERREDMMKMLKIAFPDAFKEE